jgi:hypothetical protein
MKNLLVFFLILFTLSTNVLEAQTPTDAGIPDANHVLVVYKSPENPADTLSQSLANYYKYVREIPESNICPLDSLRDWEITINDTTHIVGLAQETDIIRDFHQDSVRAIIPTKHAFKYFLDYIATPIKNWITSHNLTSVRYILLMKGVPSKAQSEGDWCCDVPGNVTVDGLLCMLNSPDYESLIFSIVNDTIGFGNPYRDVDPNFTMDYRFLPDHFTTYHNGYTVKLSYLVSHLDGISYNVVKGIIDHSIEPDISGTAAWIIDNEPTPHLNSDLLNASIKLEELGFNVVYDETDDWLTSFDGEVIGYTSLGTHAEDYNCNFNDSAWVKDSLNFDLANGSVFNTYESFNGNSLTTLNWRYVHSDTNCSGHTQGLATQFTEIGGTGTMGHAWEPKNR